MATIICQKCGASWSDSDDSPETEFQALLFSTPSNPTGSYLTVEEIIATGESMLSCPKDPIPALDRAMADKGQSSTSEARVTGKRDRGI